MERSTAEMAEATTITKPWQELSSGAVVQRLTRRKQDLAGAITKRPLHCHAGQLQSTTATLGERLSLPEKIQARYRLGQAPVRVQRRRSDRVEQFPETPQLALAQAPSRSESPPPAFSSLSTNESAVSSTGATPRTGTSQSASSTSPPRVRVSRQVGKAARQAIAPSVAASPPALQRSALETPLSPAQSAMAISADRNGEGVQQRGLGRRDRPMAIASETPVQARIRRQAPSLGQLDLTVSPGGNPSAAIATPGTAPASTPQTATKEELPVVKASPSAQSVHRRELPPGTSSPDSLGLPLVKPISVSAPRVHRQALWRRSELLADPQTSQRADSQEASMSMPLALTPAPRSVQQVPQTPQSATSAPSNGSSSSETWVTPPAPPAPTLDIGAIADQVSRILTKELTIERERRGGDL